MTELWRLIGVRVSCISSGPSVPAPAHASVLGTWRVSYDAASGVCRLVVCSSSLDIRNATELEIPNARITKPRRNLARNRRSAIPFDPLEREASSAPLLSPPATRPFPRHAARPAPRSRHAPCPRLQPHTESPHSRSAQAAQAAQAAAAAAARRHLVNDIALHRNRIVPCPVSPLSHFPTSPCPP